jgi:hypothetical protein
LIIIRDDFSILHDDYIDMLKLIMNFSKKMMGINESIAIILLLNKIQRALSLAKSNSDEKIEDIYR